MLPPLELGEVHVWTVSLDGTKEEASAARAQLDPEERARTRRFRFARDAERYARCRAALRRLLGRYLGLAARDVAFAYGANGKPELATAHGLRFNVSHSDGKALIAVSRLRAVGVDLERLRRVPDAAQLINHFSPEERRGFARLPVSERDAGFLRLWTRKEAYLKGRGLGMSPALWNDPEAGWEILALDPGPGYAAALAVQGKVPRIRMLDENQRDDAALAAAGRRTESISNINSYCS